MTTVKIQAEWKEFNGRDYTVVDTHVFDAEVLPKTYRIRYDSGHQDLLKRFSKLGNKNKLWRVGWVRSRGSFIRFEKLEESV